MEAAVVTPLNEKEDYLARTKITADLMLRIQQSRDSPLELYRNIFRDEQGRPVVIKWFHEEWAQFVLNERTFLIEAARGLSKTSFMIVAVAWLIGRNPNIRIKWLGENDDNATKRVTVIHAIIDSCPFYHLCFPHIRKEPRNSKRPNTATMLNVERDFMSPEPTVEACGVLSAGTGGRCDVLVLDDIVGETNSILNPSFKPKVLSKILNDWFMTMVANARVWCVFSPWCSDDANAYLKKHTGWKHKAFAHGKPGDVFHSIFPEIWPREELIQRRKQFGELVYARAYLLQLMKDGTVPIEPHHLRPYSQIELTHEKLSMAQAIISIDPASGRALHKGSIDYTGVAILLFCDYQDDPQASPQYEVFVVDAFQTRLATTLQPIMIWALAKQWDSKTIVVENHGMQTLAEWLDDPRVKEEDMEDVEVHGIGFGSIAKGQRLLKASPMFNPPPGSPPNIYFHPNSVRVDPEMLLLDMTEELQIEVLQNFREQVLSFPTKHDDTMDAVIQGLLWIKFNLVKENEDQGYHSSRESGSSVSCISL